MGFNNNTSGSLLSAEENAIFCKDRGAQMVLLDPNSKWIFFLWYFFHSVEVDILKSMVSKRIPSNNTDINTKFGTSRINWLTLTDNKTKNDEALFYIDAKFDTVSQKFISWVFRPLIPYLLKLRTQGISPRYIAYRIQSKIKTQVQFHS